MTEDGLRVLDGCKMRWRLPEDPIADEVLIPALRSADTFDCMVGFFGAEALRQLAPGLAPFIAHSRKPMRLLVSPLLSKDDLSGIKMGLSVPEDVLADAIGVALDEVGGLEDALAGHTLHCLAYLLASGRLEMKVVLVDDGIFHVKEWIFRAHDDIVVLSGSANFTGRAISNNVESLFLHRSWRDDDNLYTCIESLAEFNNYWWGQKARTRTIDLPTAVADDLLRTYGDGREPTEDDYRRAVSQVAGDGGPASDSSVFAVPSRLNIYEGPYAHQGRAVEAWEAASRRGIVEMATGAGKTISALVAAYRMSEQNVPLLIVIAVPTKPLVSQWADECVEFGLQPIIASAMPRQKRFTVIQDALNDLTFGVNNAEAIIVTNEGVIDPEFREMLEDYGGPTLLIADEVHNLGGVKEFTSDPPTWPTARLGLSATPTRQYDQEGTDALTEYFGPVVFQFTLDEAIGVCLVPYDYFIHRVDLVEEEREKYADLSDRIKRHVAMNNGKMTSDDDTLTKLLNRRRLILETASGKLSALAALLDAQPKGTVKRALFYATAKDPAQLLAVNELLRVRRIRAHQVTEEETSRGKLLSATLDAFASGTLDALTAKAVLDEGLNVPQIDTAYILASATTRKQWVQRRGRVLRPSPATGKTHAVIHDFIVLPPSGADVDEDERRLVKRELERCDEFARLARNRASVDGPLALLNDIRYEFLV